MRKKLDTRFPAVSLPILCVSVSLSLHRDLGFTLFGKVGNENFLSMDRLIDVEFNFNLIPFAFDF